MADVKTEIWPHWPAGNAPLGSIPRDIYDVFLDGAIEASDRLEFRRPVIPNKYVQTMTGVKMALGQTYAQFMAKCAEAALQGKREYMTPEKVEAFRVMANHLFKNPDSAAEFPVPDDAYKETHDEALMLLTTKYHMPGGTLAFVP